MWVKIKNNDNTEKGRDLTSRNEVDTFFDIRNAKPNLPIYGDVIAEVEEMGQKIVTEKRPTDKTLLREMDQSLF